MKGGEGGGDKYKRSGEREDNKIELILLQMWSFHLGHKSREKISPWYSSSLVFCLRPTVTK